MWPGWPALSASTRRRRLERRLGAGQHERRIEVALHHDVGAEPAPGVADRRAPVEPDHARPGGVHRLEQVIAPDPEVDRRGAGMAGGELGEHAPRVGQHEPLVVAGGRACRPTSRTAGRRRPRAVSWSVDEGDRRVGEPLHHAVPAALVGAHHRLGVAVVAAGTALDQVAGDRERGAGERQQRDVGGQLGGDELDRVGHVVDVVDGSSGRRRDRGRRRIAADARPPGRCRARRRSRSPTAWAGTTMSL